jgi:acetylornithine deacetylase
VNIVPDACVIEIYRRLSGDEPMVVWQRYWRVINGCRGAMPDLEAALEPPMLQDLPLETAPAERVVQVAAEALGSLGLDAEPVGVPYGSIDQAHAATEFVACDEVNQALEFYHRFLIAY